MHTLSIYKKYFTESVIIYKQNIKPNIIIIKMIIVLKTKSIKEKEYKNIKGI